MVGGRSPAHIVFLTMPQPSYYWGYLGGAVLLLLLSRGGAVPIIRQKDFECSFADGDIVLAFLASINEVGTGTSCSENTGSIRQVSITSDYFSEQNGRDRIILYELCILFYIHGKRELMVNLAFIIWFGVTELSLSLSVAELSLSFSVAELSLPFCVPELSLSFCVLELSLSFCVAELSLSFCVLELSLSFCVAELTLPAHTSSMFGCSYTCSNNWLSGIRCDACNLMLVYTHGWVA